MLINIMPNITVCKQLKFISIFVVLSVFVVRIAYSKVYVGVDAVYSVTEFQKNFGGNMFNKSAPGFNIFSRYMFDNGLGIEAGYEAYQKKHKNIILYNNDYLAGYRLKNLFNSSMKLESVIKQRNTYLGLLLNSNINSKSFVSTLFGVGIYDIYAKYIVEYPLFSLQKIGTFSKKKPVAMVRLSMEYQLKDTVAIRAFILWKDTFGFKISSEEETSGNLIKLKVSANAGLGIVIG